MSGTGNHVETNPRHISKETGGMYEGNEGASRGAQYGQSALNAIKQAGHGSENLRQGANAFFDNAIQPAAARDADRGVTESHKVPPSTHGTEGSEIREGPARGTGTSGYGQKLTGTGASNFHTGTTSAGGSSGFSNDARNVGRSVMDKIVGSGSSGSSTK